MNYDIEQAISYRKIKRVRKLLKSDKTLLQYIVPASLYDYLYLREFKNLDKLFKILPKWKIEQLMAAPSVCYLFDVTSPDKVKELYAFIRKYDFNMCMGNPISYNGLTIMSFLDVFMTVNCVGSVCSKFHKDVFDFIYRRARGCYERDYFLNSVLFNIAVKKQEPLNIPFMRHIITKDMLKDKDNGLIHPLYTAIRLNQFEFLKLLVEKGVDINTVNHSNSALNYALDMGALEEIVRYLIDKGIDTQRTGNNFELPFQAMYINGEFGKYSVELKKLLLSFVRDMNHQDTYGRTPAHYVLMYENWRSFGDILKNKAIDVNIVDKTNTSVMMLLKEDERNDFLQIVGRHRAKETPDDVNIAIPETEFAKFNLSNATLVDLMFYTLLILQKYPEVSIPYYKSDIEVSFPENIMNNRDMYIVKKSSISVAYILRHVDGKVYVHPMLKEALLNLETRYGLLYVDILTETSAHANCIIIDNVTKNIYHFEPNGRFASNGYNLKALYDYLGKYFRGINPKYKYNTPYDFLPQISFQQLADEDNIRFTKINDLLGYCLAWCFWFTELFLNNKHDNVKLLVEKAIKKMIGNKYYIKDFIRNYANRMFEKKVKFLLDLGFQENMVYNKMYPESIEMVVVNAMSKGIEKLLHKEKSR